jgi:hypothetical protein
MIICLANYAQYLVPGLGLRGALSCCTVVPTSHSPHPIVVPPEDVSDASHLGMCSSPCRSVVPHSQPGRTYTLHLGGTPRCHQGCDGPGTKSVDRSCTPIDTTWIRSNNKEVPFITSRSHSPLRVVFDVLDLYVLGDRRYATYFSFFPVPSLLLMRTSARCPTLSANAFWYTKNAFTSPRARPARPSEEGFDVRQGRLAQIQELGPVLYVHRLQRHHLDPS